MKLPHSTGILFFLLFLIPEQAFNQDKIFKKDSSVLKVNIIDITGKTVVYKIQGDTTGITFYLSKSLLDSLKYSKGEVVDFTDYSNNEKLQQRQVKRNYFQIELVNTLYGNLNLDYERISKGGRASLITGFLININPSDQIYLDEGPFQSATFDQWDFFIRMGVNFYPFNTSLIRTGILEFSTGFSVLLGSCRKIDYDNYYYGNGSDHVFAANLMWNIRERIYLGDHFQISGGIEASILPFLVFICPQIGLSIGF
jgi:hypothetical protein